MRTGYKKIILCVCILLFGCEDDNSKEEKRND